MLDSLVMLAAEDGTSGWLIFLIVAAILVFVVVGGIVASFFRLWLQAEHSKTSETR